MSANEILVANAPASFGVFELTFARPDLIPPDDVLDAVAAAGYDGIDLGPPGYLAPREELRVRLERRRLALAGGWIQLSFADHDAFSREIRELDSVLDLFDAGNGGRLPPKPTLADAGAPSRRSNPGRGRDLPEIGLTDDEWKVLAARVQQVADRVRDRGFEATFHHHIATYVEAPHEIERLLELTNVGLCLDTGHLLLGGGDPLRALRDWGSRINHLHLKDCRMSVMERLVSERAEMREVWRRGAFCRLGDGDVDLNAFLRGVQESGFAGWLVVEQDKIPESGSGIASLADDQAANRRLLKRYGF